MGPPENLQTQTITALAYWLVWDWKSSHLALPASLILRILITFPIMKRTLIGGMHLVTNPQYQFRHAIDSWYSISYSLNPHYIYPGRSPSPLFMLRSSYLMVKNQVESSGFSGSSGARPLGDILHHLNTPGHESATHRFSRVSTTA